MSERFSRSFRARWADMDFNAHMGNTAYLDVAPDVRLAFFEAQGFPPREFERLGIGPIIFEDRIQYFKELHLLDRFEVTMEMDGLSEDGRKFRIRNDVLTEDGELAARVTSSGAWLHREERRIVKPPDGLLKALRAARRTEEFEVL